MQASPPTATPLPWTNQDVTLYHGTLTVNASRILQFGPKRSAGGSARYNDFGPGFYTTTLRRQAEAWAWLRARRLGGSPALVIFTLARDALARLETLAFVRGGHDADDFWSFVFHCLNGAQDHARIQPAKDYDAVVGPVVASSGRQRIVMLEYDQVSFHTDHALDVLKSAAPQEEQL